LPTWQHVDYPPAQDKPKPQARTTLINEFKKKNTNPRYINLVCFSSAKGSSPNQTAEEMSIQSSSDTIPKSNQGSNLQVDMWTGDSQMYSPSDNISSFSEISIIQSIDPISVASQPQVNSVSAPHSTESPNPPTSEPNSLNPVTNIVTTTNTDLITPEAAPKPESTISALTFWSMAQSILANASPGKYHLWSEQNIALDIALTQMSEGIYLDSRSSVEESAAWLEWAFSVKGTWKRRSMVKIPGAVRPELVNKYQGIFGNMYDTFEW
jgi:hypothetical protein